MVRRRTIAQPSGHTILVIDDQEDILISVRLLLEREGHKGLPEPELRSRSFYALQRRGCTGARCLPPLLRRVHKANLSTFLRLRAPNPC